VSASSYSVPKEARLGAADELPGLPIPSTTATATTPAVAAPVVIAFMALPLSLGHARTACRNRCVLTCLPLWDGLNIGAHTSLMGSPAIWARRDSERVTQTTAPRAMRCDPLQRRRSLVWHIWLVNPYIVVDRAALISMT
jgi:hypothetical protein